MSAVLTEWTPPVVTGPDPTCPTCKGWGFLIERRGDDKHPYCCIACCRCVECAAFRAEMSAGRAL